MYVTLLPLIFLPIMTVFAVHSVRFYMEENWFLFGLDIVALPLYDRSRGHVGTIELKKEKS